MENSFDFIMLFKKKLNSSNINWDIKALIDSDNNLITLGTDSKLIGRIFELKSQSILQEIANDNPNYKLEKPKNQTVYPDFLYVCPNGSKIAVDIKTCYRDPAKGKLNIAYTLGAYTSFLRNGTKNIVGNYKDYTHHYIIGFIYDRLSDEDGQIMPYTPENLAKIPVPYGNVKVWVQEKYKIAGYTEGSGNTANIKSIESNIITDFEDGNGPFSVLGENIFEDYWRNYKKKSGYKSIEQYLSWAKKNSTLKTEIDFPTLEKEYIKWRLHNCPTKEDSLKSAIRVLLIQGKKGAQKELLIETNNNTRLTISKKKSEIMYWISFCKKNHIPYEIEQS